MINEAARVEAAGAAVHVVAFAAVVAEVGGVLQPVHGGAKLGQVEVLAVGGGLHGVGGDGHPEGAGVGEAEPVVQVFAPAPAADIHPVALVHEEGGGGYIDGIGGGADHGAEAQRVEVGAEFLDVLGRARVAVAAGADGHPAQRLAQQVGFGAGVELQKVRLVVGGGAEVGGVVEGAAAGREPGYEAVHVAAPGRLEAAGGGGEVGAGGAAGHKNAARRVALQRVGGIGPAAAEQGAEAQAAEAGAEAGHHGIGGAAVVGAAEAVGDRKIGGGGGGGHVHVVLGIEQHVAPEIVAVVVAQARLRTLHTQQAVVVGAAKEGAGQQRIAGHRKAGQH